MAYFISISKLPTAPQIAQLLLDHVFWLHGLLDAIISDCAPSFTANIWAAFLRLLGIEFSLSPAYHLETDGQMEHVNQILEQYLHCFI